MREELSPTIIFKTLDRAISSPALGPGSRLPALLRYLVIEELEGRGADIKAFSIAADVFGRGSDFDPQTDSIVRVEVGRLRRSLQLYNATDGAHAPWQIEIPKGAYRPVFVQKTPATAGPDFSMLPALDPASPDDDGPAAQDAGLSWTGLPALHKLALNAAFALVIALALVTISIWVDAFRRRTSAPGPLAQVTKPLVVVRPITFSSDTAGTELIAEGLRADISARLASFHLQGVTEAERAIDGSAPPNNGIAHTYVLNLVAQVVQGVLRVRATLTDGSSQVVEWSQFYQASLDVQRMDIFKLVEDTANRVAIDVGRPLGAISRAEFAKRPQAPASLSPQDKRYLCMVIFFNYGRNLSDELRQEARACLAETVAADASFADGFAALAATNLDLMRAGKEPLQAMELLRAARAQANRAFALSPDAPLPLLATMTVAACSGDGDTMRRKARQITEAFPYWPEILSIVGAEIALVLDDWDRGLDLLRRASAYNTSPEPWYGIAFAVNHILANQPKIALEDLPRAAQRSFERGHLVRLAAAQLSGNTTEMAVAIEDLRRLGYPDKQAVLGLLDAECWSPRVKFALRPALEKTF